MVEYMIYDTFQGQVFYLDVKNPKLAYSISQKSYDMQKDEGEIQEDE